MNHFSGFHKYDSWDLNTGSTVFKNLPSLESGFNSCSANYDSTCHEAVILTSYNYWACTAKIKKKIQLLVHIPHWDSLAKYEPMTAAKKKKGISG